MKKYNVVVLGATGAVGIEFRKILLERNFPIDNIRFLGKTTVGQEIDFGGRKVKVEAVTDQSFKGFDIALFSAGASISREVAGKAAESGCVVVDNSSAWRMDPAVPLVVPEVNPSDVEWHKGVIANPNCSTIQMVVALKPFMTRRRSKDRGEHYQAVSARAQGDRGVRNPVKGRSR
jgi:aspartate-semialdehyde dehydrogenase